ncbi:hypothetical protein C7477_10164 [Phyllobacterium leguminum]|uniref:Uncharacterized protein n=1 Tax=Phyllobacterium leguminum TaxID=314237 RepID=A0A318TFD3_9HYPH|nr:hypothetical protein C7477_10164 [Phyllobacterium leguminum]
MNIYAYLTLAIPVVMMIGVIVFVHFMPLDSSKRPRR